MILGNRRYCANLVLFHGVQQLVGVDRVLMVEMLYECNIWLLNNILLSLSLSFSAFLCISYCAFRLDVNSNDLTGGIPDTGHLWRDAPLPPRGGTVEEHRRSTTGVPPARHRRATAHPRAAVGIDT